MGRWIQQSDARKSVPCAAKGGKNRKEPMPFADAPKESKVAPSLTDSPDLLPLVTSSVSHAAPSSTASQPPKPQPQAWRMEDGDEGTTASTSSSGPPSSGASFLNVAWRRVLRELSSLPRAIALMALIAGLSGLGTIIPQNKPLEYYVQNYPEEVVEGGSKPKVLGFLTYPLLLNLQLNRIYTANYFYLSLGLLAASLAACTATTQWPTAKVAQRWRYAKTPEAVVKIGNAEVLPNARVNDLGRALGGRGYQVFLQDGCLYAFKGLAGRLGPIGVHAALLLILGGTSYSGFGGFKGSVMCPEGQDFAVVEFMRPSSPISSLPGSAKTARITVDDFTIDYRPDGSVAQFYSTLSLRDPSSSPSSSDGPAMMTKRISVNDPFRFSGVTLYQTDWSLAAVTLKVQRMASPSSSAAEIFAAAAADQAAAASTASASPDSLPTPSYSPPLTGEAFNLPLASLEGKPGIAGRLWGSFLPIAAPGINGEAPKGISILARDPQSVVIYDSKGKFVGVRRPDSGKPIEVEGLSLVVQEIIGSTGLELKSDPGVPWVYAGFGGLMITTLISYLSHSQVWALQQGTFVYVAGKSNRAVLGFEKELDEVLEAVPELNT